MCQLKHNSWAYVEVSYQLLNTYQDEKDWCTPESALAPQTWCTHACERRSSGATSAQCCTYFLIFVFAVKYCSQMLPDTEWDYSATLASHSVPLLSATGQGHSASLAAQHSCCRRGILTWNCLFVCFFPRGRPAKTSLLRNNFDNTILRTTKLRELLTTAIGPDMAVYVWALEAWLFTSCAKATNAPSKTGTPKLSDVSQRCVWQAYDHSSVEQGSLFVTLLEGNCCMLHIRATGM